MFICHAAILSCEYSLAAQERVKVDHITAKYLISTFEHFPRDVSVGTEQQMICEAMALVCVISPSVFMQGHCSQMFMRANHDLIHNYMSSGSRPGLSGVSIQSD